MAYISGNYTVTYNNNGGTGGPGSQTGAYGANTGSNYSFSLSSAKPSRTGYDFRGWATSSGGPVAYAAGGVYSFTIRAQMPDPYPITLYAVWTKKTYPISYNKGSNGAGTNTSDTKTYGTALTLKGAIFTRTGYTQTGWSTTDGGAKVYDLSASYTINAAVTLYPFWTVNTWTVSYNKGSNGTGTNTSDTKTYGKTLTLKGAIFTRTGYIQTGWSTTDGGAKVYDLSASYTTNAAVTLYPYWTAGKSIISSLTSSVPMDGSTQATVSITRYSSAYTHTVIVSLGTKSASYTNVATSKSFTIPTSWVTELPAATSGTATVTVQTYSGSTLIGSVSGTLAVTVPASVKPTVSLSAQNVNSNTAINGWNVLVEGYSKIKLTATASAGQGSSIQSIAFSGDGVSQNGAANTATSSLLKSTGSRTWKVIVTDRRGRTAEATITRTVYAYTFPTVKTLSAFRCTSEGTRNEHEGTYIKAAGSFTFSSINGQNSITSAVIKYKAVTDTTWNTGKSGAESGAAYIFGGGNIDLLRNYLIQITVTDAVGNAHTREVSVSSIKGFSVGTKGDRARFGGPVQKPGLQVDWDTEFGGVVDVIQRRSYGRISSVGWYRVMTLSASEVVVKGGIAWTVDIEILDWARQSHRITLYGLLGSDTPKFANEVSVATVSYVDSIRYVQAGAYGYIDVHYTGAISRCMACHFNVHTSWSPEINETDMQSYFVSNDFERVADAPAGETVLAVYQFGENRAFSNLPVKQGTWIPKVYDYNTYKFDLPEQPYYQIGNMVFASVYYTGTNNRGIELGEINTMLQIRGLPFSTMVLPGHIYMGWLTASPWTVQTSNIGLYIRPNVTKATDECTGLFSAGFVGII